MSDITLLLRAWSGGDESALEQLAPLVERELRRIAESRLRGERPGHTLQPTDLVNEAYLRLIDWKGAAWQDRVHFFAVASKMMRRILVNYARRRQTEKRAGGETPVTIADGTKEPGISLDVVALDRALDQLAGIDERKSRIVELRFFGGLAEEEIVEVTGIPLRTLQREWNLARAWLYRALSGDAPA